MSNHGHSDQPHNKNIGSAWLQEASVFLDLDYFFGDEVVLGVRMDSLEIKSNGKVNKVLGRKSAFSLWAKKEVRTVMGLSWD